MIRESLRARVCAGLVVILGTAALPAAAVEVTPPVFDAVSIGHKEEPDDSFLPPLPDGPRPREAPAEPVLRDMFVSVQVNVNAQGNNIFGDAANEPSIAIDPTDPNKIVIGWRQFNSVSSNFRQAGWAYSHDAGRTWTCPGVLQSGVFRSDPVLAANADGVFFYYSLKSDFSCQMFRSTNGGVSWSSQISAYGGDKAWMTIDLTDGPGRGNIYIPWSPVAGCCGDRIFTRSTNGGFNYLDPITMPRSPRWGTAAVAPDGALYVVGDNGGGSMVLVRSSNAQDAGQTPVFELDRTINLGGSLGFSGGPNPAGLLGQAWVAADRSSGPLAGNIYVLASVDPPGDDPLDVMFIRSSDRGVTWSSPRRINGDPENNLAWQWFGTMSVAPNGRIDAVWNDTRNSMLGNTSELYYSYSLDGGWTWTLNMAVTPPFNHTVGYPNQNKLGDYYHMISDNFGANLTYAATFNGEQDVYFVRISPLDCNNNFVLDEDDIAGGTSADCNFDAIPDECQNDCNANGLADECDVFGGTSADCNLDEVPDECQLGGNDCNANARPDDCDREDVISTDPQDAGACPGDDAVFAVTVTPPAVTYQWERNGVALSNGSGVSGATSATLTLTAVDTADAGDYTCVVTYGCLVATSRPATLTVVASPTVTSHPRTLLHACAGNDASFSVGVSGTPPFSYQWYRDGQILPAATSAILTLSAVSAEQDGALYSCFVNNACGSAWSDSGELNVVPLPAFSVHPQDACGEPGEDVTLAAAATAQSPLFWQWWKDDELLAGESAPTLALLDLFPQDAGLYSARAIITAPTFCAAWSDPAEVIVGGCPQCAAPGDLDGDGDWDLADVARFAGCFGSGGAWNPGCACANRDADQSENVDLLDWQMVVDALTGPQP